MWDLTSLRCTQPRDFWRFLRAPVRPPVPSHSEFLEEFETLFGGAGAEPVPDYLVEALEAVQHEPVRPEEVERAAAAMAMGKSTALSQVPLEYIRGHRCGAIWQVLAELFNTFIVRGYP